MYSIYRHRSKFEEASLSNVFIFSSNVDSHWRRDQLFESELFEFHGTVEEWSCSGSAEGHKMKPCCKTVWSVPKGFQFQVDANMRAESESKEGGLDEACSEVSDGMDGVGCPNFWSCKDEGCQPTPLASMWKPSSTTRSSLWGGGIF